MLIIGERINSSRKSIKEAIARKNGPFLIEEARRQLSNGASFIDVNCAASMQKEAEDLIWLIAQIQQALDCKISIDSPSTQAIKAALKIHKGSPFINSITAEKQRLELMLPLVKENNGYVVALTMDEKGIPQDAEEKLRLADKIIEAATNVGIPKQNVYVDPLVKPIGIEPEQAYSFLGTVRRLKDKGIKTIGGLSNVSFGLPRRNLLNAAFLKLAIECGIDAAILDPTDNLIKRVLDGKELPRGPFILAKDALLGRDSAGLDYINAFRKGRLNF